MAPQLTHSFLVATVETTTAAAAAAELFEANEVLVVVGVVAVALGGGNIDNTCWQPSELLVPILLYIEDIICKCICYIILSIYRLYVIMCQVTMCACYYVMVVVVVVVGWC